MTKRRNYGRSETRYPATFTSDNPIKGGKDSDMIVDGLPRIIDQPLESYYPEGKYSSDYIKQLQENYSAPHEYTEDSVREVTDLYFRAIMNHITTKDLSSQHIEVMGYVNDKTSHRCNEHECWSDYDTNEWFLRFRIKGFNDIYRVRTHYKELLEGYFNCPI